ncbi:unnamed protein product [Vicia faba]|uniref:Uncharacterized protein n=1 Tax=Vicia faba TaxID=3906 RepID=A0AAV0YMY6_VICFA|nr:unnamed protein product [Vicia faba]
MSNIQKGMGFESSMIKKITNPYENFVPLEKKIEWSCDGCLGPIRITISVKGILVRRPRKPLGGQDVDKDVLDISYDMLVESQMYKENDDHFHEDVEVDTIIISGGFDNNHDHEIIDDDTLC